MPTCIAVAGCSNTTKEGVRKVYIFFPKDANFSEQPLHAACVRESESTVITSGMLAQSRSASRSGWLPQLAVMLFCHWPISKDSLNSTKNTLFSQNL